VIYFQLGLTSCLSLSPTNAIILWIHQAIDPFIRSKPLKFYLL
jgi:hypothetical protein